MGLFGFGKKLAQKKEYQYRMYFDAPINDERDQTIKSLVLKHLGDMGVSVDNVKTTSNGYYGSKAVFTGLEGEEISIECARTPMNEESSSFIAIKVKTNVCGEEAVNKAFHEIKVATYDKGYFFTEF